MIQGRMESRSWQGQSEHTGFVSVTIESCMKSRMMFCWFLLFALRTERMFTKEVGEEDGTPIT